jgi:hypothetical protein
MWAAPFCCHVGTPLRPASLALAAALAPEFFVVTVRLVLRTKSPTGRRAASGARTPIGEHRERA